MPSMKLSLLKLFFSGEPFGAIGSHFEPLGAIWLPMVPNGSQMTPNDPQMAPNGSEWLKMVFIHQIKENNNSFFYLSSFYLYILTW